MALPKEPRQKMINIMYLVLTAILALNISAEILNAFKTVERSLATTNTTINASTSTIMQSFEDKKLEPQSRAKAEIWQPKAALAVQYTTEINKYIETIKAQILKDAGFDPAKKGDSTFKEDNQEVATHLMVESGKGKELLAKLTDYKKKMIAIDDSLGKQIDVLLKQINLEPPPTKNKANSTWEAAYFRMVPTVAATTILTKFQNDVKTSENRVVSLFHEQVGAVKVRFNKFAAIVGQSSNYLMPDQELEIKAGIGAFSTDAKPVISIAGVSQTTNEEGMAVYKTRVSGNGERTVPILIKYVDQDGNAQEVRQEIKYTVGQANASIALDKMNVLYIGVPNPITVAASGGGDDRIAVSINGGGGSLQKSGPGKYNAFVTGGSECTITVSVDGKVSGASQFRIRSIPTPTGTVGGSGSGDNVNAGAFKAQAGVGAYIKDFPFELKYTVTSFTISTDSDDGDIIEANVQGNAWGGNASARNVLAQIKAGKTVYIDNIRATGEDGKSKKLPSLVYYIK